MNLYDFLILGQVLFFFVVSWWILLLAAIGILAILFVAGILIHIGDQILNA